MNQYDELQCQALRDAEKLASGGEDFSHLCKLMDGERQLRLKIFVQQLPNEIARKTIYDRAVTNEEEPKSKKVARPRCKGDKGR
jgi:hypothetical protein